MVLHDDDRLLPNMLSTQLDILDKNSDIIALSCNGYFIDHDGHNLGKKIINSFHNCIEKFNNSSAVGEKFFSNSCIPFSSTIYRYHKVKDIASKNQIVHKIYNQVSDVVLFMKLADIGVVALNNFALYECRIHNYQDSYNFDEKFLFNLRRYAKYKAKGDLIQKRNLLNTIKIYYSYNIFIFFLKGITNGKCIKIYKNLDYEFFTFKFVYLLWRIILSKIKILFNK